MEIGEALVAMTAILICGAVIILPTLALTMRFVLKPMMETWARARVPGAVDERLEAAERRVAILEEHVKLLERQNAKLLEDAEFLLKPRGS